MKGSLKTRLSVVGAVTTIALAGALPAQADDPPAGMSPQAYQALVKKSEALNDAYVARAHGMSPRAYRALRLRSEALERRYGGGHNRALILRGKALNERYGLGDSEPRTTATTPRVTVVASDGFDWGDAGIGAGAGLGFVLLTAGIAVAARHRRGPRLGASG